MLTNYKKYLLLVCMAGVGLLGSCTKYNFVDTGSPIAEHHTTMWDYFATNTYDWRLTRVMIEHAGLKDYFEGKSQYGNNLTFLGITDISIRRYLFGQLSYSSPVPAFSPQQEEELVRKLDPALCREILLTSLIEGRLMLSDIPSGMASTSSGSAIGTGGKEYKTLSGKTLWIYTFRTDYEGAVGKGPVVIYVQSKDTGLSTTVASSDIKTASGIVHSLQYDFTPNSF